MATQWPAAKNPGESVSTTDWNALVAAMRSWPAPPAESVNANQNTLANLAALYVGNVYVTGGMDLAGKNLSNLGALSFAAGGRVADRLVVGSSDIDLGHKFLVVLNNLYTFITPNDTASPKYVDIGAYEAGVGWKNLVLCRGGGNVGIGTATPAYPLQVNGTIALTKRYAETPSQLFQDNGNGILQLQAHLNVDREYPVRIGVPDSTGALAFYTSDPVTPPTAPTFTERMRIAATGNVGIGTQSPQYALHVVRTGGAGSMVKVQDTSNSGAGVLFQTSQGSASIGLGVYSGPGYTANLQLVAGAAIAVFSASNGNIGFGTNGTDPHYALSWGNALGKHIALFESGGGFIYGIGMTGTDTAADPYRTRILASAIEGISVTNIGHVRQNVPASAPADAGLPNSSLCIWYDEANNRLAFKCKTSGNVVKTGYIPVS